MPVSKKRPAAKRAAPRARKPRVGIQLDIACGQTKGPTDEQGVNHPEGWTGVDIAPGPAVDVTWDLNIYPWPFDDASVDRARCSHYIEHIPHDIGTGLDGFLAFGNELARVLKQGAQCEIWAPYYSSIRAIQDPTHLRSISEASFLYWNQDWLKSNGLDHYGVTCDFDFAYGYRITNPYWATAHDEKRAWALMHYMNVAEDIYVTLTKR